jgi:DNA-binding CsgD family transcriptional regulator
MLIADDVARVPATRLSLVSTNSPAWPVSGRKKTMSEITRALAEDSGGVLVTGASGMGKTLLTTQALKQFKEDSLVVTLRCSSALSRSPYGALNILLNDLEPGYLEHPVLVLSGLMRLLRERAAGRTVYLFLDNASELDELTAVTVAQLARNGAARVVLTCSAPHRLSPELSGLCEDGTLTRIELEPLSFRDAVQWLEEGMKARVSHTAVHELWTGSDGNPQYLKMLAMELADTGSLELRDGVWVLTSGRSVHGRAITDLVASRLGRLGEADRRILEILSLADTVPLETLLELVEADDVDALEERGVLAVEDSMPRRVRIQNQLIADVVRENVPPGRSSQLRDLVLTATDPARQQAAMELSLASWALDCGAELSPGEALSAARLANRSMDPGLALRLVRAVPGHQASAPAVMEEVVALVRLGESDDALRAIHTYREAHPQSKDRPAGLLLAECSALLARSGSDQRAAECLDQARQELFPPGPDQSENLSEEASRNVRELREQLMLCEVGSMSHSGRYPEIAAMLTFELDSGHYHSADFKLLAASWLCEAWALTGRQSDARDMAGHLQLQCLRSEVAPASANSAMARLRYAYLVGGSWDEASESLMTESWIAAPAFDGPRNSAEVSEAVYACLQGRGQDALELLIPAISQLRVRDNDGVVGVASAAAAYASALQGDRGRVAEYLGQGELGSQPTSWKFARAERYFTAMARAELGEHPAAIDELVHLADEDRDAGAVGHELLCLSSAVRLGNRAITGRLLEAAGRNQGPFAQLCALYARAVLTGSAEALLSAADLASRMKNDRFALDIAESVLGMDSLHIDRSLIRQAKHLAASCRRRLHAPQDGHEGGPALTSRELQIAQLAAAGASNKSIAAHLHVSVRTVEGHLYQIYGKLKIGERLELQLALGDAGDDLR